MVGGGLHGLGPSGVVGQPSCRETPRRWRRRHTTRPGRSGCVVRSCFEETKIASSPSSGSPRRQRPRTRKPALSLGPIETRARMPIDQCFGNARRFRSPGSGRQPRVRAHSTASRTRRGSRLRGGRALADCGRLCRGRSAFRFPKVPKRPKGFEGRGSMFALLSKVKGVGDGGSVGECGAVGSRAGGCGAVADPRKAVGGSAAAVLRRGHVAGLRVALGLVQLLRIVVQRGPATLSSPVGLTTSRGATVEDTSAWPKVRSL